MWKNCVSMHRTQHPRLRQLPSPISHRLTGSTPWALHYHSFSTAAEDISDPLEMTITLMPDFGINDCYFPPLPKINSPVVARQVFTHRSFFARAAHVFEDPLDDPSPDNEKFEHLGDSVLQTCITSLLMDMFPGLRVGPATKIRSMVVANYTLAQIAVKYRLPDHLILHPAQAITLRASINIRANIFEAFVGGLYIDQGLEAVSRWVNLLFRPYAIAAYGVAREQHGLPPLSYHSIQLASLGQKMIRNSSAVDPTEHHDLSTTTGHLALFNQHVQRSCKSVEWKYADQWATYEESAPGNRGAKTTPVWFVTVMVDGQFYGSGKGSTKKAARNEAAKAGLVKLGIEV